MREHEKHFHNKEKEFHKCKHEHNETEIQYQSKISQLNH